jgi:hypothetical protein
MSSTGLRHICLVSGLGILAAIVMFAVHSSSRWVAVSNDSPWSGSNYQAKEQQRKGFNWNAGILNRSRWLDTNGVVYDMELIAHQCERFLMSANRDSKSNTTPTQEALPWKTIVSISPTVALIVPSDPVKSRKGWLLGTNHPVRTFDSGYDCGTRVLFNVGMSWFSPDLAIGPEPISFDRHGFAEIKLNDGKLELKIEGETCRIERK